MAPVRPTVISKTHRDRLDGVGGKGEPGPGAMKDACLRRLGDAAVGRLEGRGGLFGLHGGGRPAAVGRSGGHMTCKQLQLDFRRGGKPLRGHGGQVNCWRLNAIICADILTPSLRRQFSSAKAISTWTHTGRSAVRHQSAKRLLQLTITQ